MTQQRLGIDVIGVVGAGAMGSGIAQIAAQSGAIVRILDQRDGAAKAARQGILTRMEKRVADGKAARETVDTLERNLQPVASIAELGGCGLVIEAVVEDLDIKRTLFSELTDVVADDTVLASNTSSLPIGAICAGLAGPERFAGLHFFNPVPVMKLVEVIRAPDTADWVVDGLAAFCRKMGREPVEVRDTPGFLVNFGGRAYTTEALAIVHEGVATPAEVDAIMRDCCGFRMGPFELMDLTGMDVNYPVTEFVHRASFFDPRLRSTPLHRYMQEVGKLGRKTGEGFFRYGDAASTPDPDAATTASPSAAIVLAGETGGLEALIRACGLDIRDADDGVSPILAALTGEDCAAFCARTGNDHRRLVAVDLAFDTNKRITVMTAPGADPACCDRVIAMLAKDRAVTAISDSPGFVAQRISAMVANLGCEMAQIGLAGPSDIDKAMRLGLNYPKGPLELADSLGTGTVFEILRQMQALTGDDRYRPSSWLRRRAQLGLSALTT